jgi:hypothetical protein
VDFIYPLTAVVSDEVAKTFDKLNFSRNKIAAMYLMWPV